MKNAELISKSVIGEGRFLRLCDNIFSDEEGRERHWESVERTNSTGAVMIAAFLKESRRVLFVRQYRPPAGKYTIELPAGLLDKAGESVEEAALRELYEETGYDGKVLKVLAPAYSSPGMSRETITIVFVEIDDTLYPEPPEAHNDAGECIEVFAVPIDEISCFLEERQNSGDAVEARTALSPWLMPSIFSSLK
ncbi:MAG: NUDIX hydrolase [Lentisphaeria bacterium]|nr:NUDIX hydrolase [Lentisphaeria bacterium]